MAQLKWYFDDFDIGKCIEVGSRTVSEEEIIHFAEQFDPQPFHVDHDAAGKSIYGGIIASGWHTCSIIMRLMVDGFYASLQVWVLLVWMRFVGLNRSAGVIL